MRKAPRALALRHAARATLSVSVCDARLCGLCARDAETPPYAVWSVDVWSASYKLVVVYTLLLLLAIH